MPNMFDESASLLVDATFDAVASVVGGAEAEYSRGSGGAGTCRQYHVRATVPHQSNAAIGLTRAMDVGARHASPAHRQKTERR